MKVLQNARPSAARQHLAYDVRVVLVDVHEQVVHEGQFGVVVVNLHVAANSDLAVLEVVVATADVVLRGLQQPELGVVGR